ncbi:MAG TPA: hypothetical protein DD381_01335 [Lentisphaeria bacterium]|nr:MAG: hypothetical protein A2X47_10695 [Lentisphaerae bacterium GWF2_38_69]HBM14987.1 hypothetical protein [Lentisphaeria bacterium]
MEGNSSNNAIETLYAGEFTHSMDSQRRVAIPSEWRAKDGDNRFYVLPGRHNAVQLMPYHTFKSMAERLKKVSSVDPKASLALAKLGASSRECLPDKQGRVHIPEQLLEHAQIKRGSDVDSELVMVGVFNSIQIWSTANWSRQQMSYEEMLDVVQSIDEIK